MAGADKKKCRDCGATVDDTVQRNPRCRPCAIAFYRAKAESGDLLVLRSQEVV